MAARPPAPTVCAARFGSTARSDRHSMRSTCNPPAPPTDLTPAERAALESPGVREALEEFTRDTPTWLSGVGLRNDTQQLQRAQLRLWPDGAVVPTLVLHGDADEVVPIASAEEYARLVPGATLEVLEGYGHAVPLFARSLVVDRLRTMLAVTTS